MDPTQKRQPKSTISTTTSKPHRHHPTHPLPDPTTTTTTTIQKYISHQFSNKKFASLMPSRQHSRKPQLDQNFQPKSPSVPSVMDTSCTTLTKSKSQNERDNVGNLGSKVKEKYNNISEIKKPSKKEPKISSSESQVIPTSLLVSDQSMKKSQQGYEMRRPSISSVPIDGGTRRSFCSSHVELADFLSCNGVKVVAVDMPPLMQIHAVDCARKTHDSLEKFTSKTLAFTLKKEFDGVYGPAWHCIVGTGFGSFVTHSVGGFLYFSMDHKLYVLLFKTAVQRAD